MLKVLVNSKKSIQKHLKSEHKYITMPYVYNIRLPYTSNIYNGAQIIYELNLLSNNNF